MVPRLIAWRGERCHQVEAIVCRACGKTIMKTQGELEAAIGEVISRFEQEYMGRGPKSMHAHLIGDFVVVRLQGVLTAAEQQLVKTLPAERGRDLLKQVRTHLIETARPVLERVLKFRWIHVADGRKPTGSSDSR